MPADYTDQMSPDHVEDPYGERDSTRRRNTLVLVAVAAAVCLVGTLLAFNGLTSGGGSGAVSADGGAGEAAVSGTKTTAPGKKDSKKPKPPADLVSFVSPSGNIGCVLSSEGARCDIEKKEWGPPPKPAECNGSWGAGVAVGARKAELVCAKDSAIKGGKALDYGSSQKRGDFVCESSEEGMRCENRKTGHGFTIARADYSTF
jgi:hypothetical protein